MAPACQAPVRRAEARPGKGGVEGPGGGTRAFLERSPRGPGMVASASCPPPTFRASRTTLNGVLDVPAPPSGEPGPCPRHDRRAGGRPRCACPRNGNGGAAAADPLRPAGPPRRHRHDDRGVRWRASPRRSGSGSAPSSSTPRSPRTGRRSSTTTARSAPRSAGTPRRSRRATRSTRTSASTSRTSPSPRSRPWTAASQQLPDFPQQEQVTGVRMSSSRTSSTSSRRYRANQVKLNIETKVEAGAPSETAPREQFVAGLRHEIHAAGMRSRSPSSASTGAR